jgi:hypothetical protein
MQMGIKGNTRNAAVSYIAAWASLALAVLLLPAWGLEGYVGIAAAVCAAVFTGYSSDGWHMLPL